MEYLIVFSVVAMMTTFVRIIARCPARLVTEIVHSPLPVPRDSVSTD
jgi:hypothetical protein